MVMSLNEAKEFIEIVQNDLPYPAGGHKGHPYYDKDHPLHTPYQMQYSEAMRVVQEKDPDWMTPLEAAREAARDEESYVQMFELSRLKNR